MKLKSVQINGFGKLENKKIDFDNGINLIIGKNESGKSTLMGFIKCLFYGVNKNKAGNEFSDFEKYKPWKDIEFSGKAEYEIEGKNYSIFRDFNKNNAKVYDETGNDITKNYSKDKNRGISIGMEDFKIDEDTFENTTFVTQRNVDVEVDSQKNIMQKLANMIQSGDENISYENILKKVEKILYEEVGTERTQNKPKNIINRDINLKRIQRDQLIGKRDRQEIIEMEKKKLENKLNDINKDIDVANKVYEIKEKYQNLLNEKRNAFEAEQRIIEKQKQEYLKKKEKTKKSINILSIVITFIIIALSIIIKKYLIFITIIPIVLLLIINNVDKNTNNYKTIELSQFDLTIEELKKKENKELQQLEKSGIKKSMLDRRITEIRDLRDGYEKTKNDYILQSHKLKLEEETLEHSVNKLNELEEEIESLNEKKKAIDEKEESLKLALEVFEKSYEELKARIVPDIAQEIRRWVTETTNGEYTNVKYNDEIGILIENKYGEIVTINKLSVGAIDQIYLGFRIAILKKLSDVPLMLDETFVYYDAERLENILRTLNTISSQKQIMLFTCSEREKEILDKMKVEYNLIEM